MFLLQKTFATTLGVTVMLFLLLVIRARFESWPTCLFVKWILTKETALSAQYE